jgi:DNA-binding MarR family transcriptional regulator
LPLDERVTMSTISPPVEQYRAAAALRAALRRFSQASEHTLAQYGLTSERYELLLEIKKAGGGSGRATVSELRAGLGVAQSSVTQLVRRAEDTGLLRREVSSSDARVRYLLLTAQGERQLAGAVAALHEERTRLAEVVSQL